MTDPTLVAMIHGSGTLPRVIATRASDVLPVSVPYEDFGQLTDNRLVLAQGVLRRLKVRGMRNL